jgi:hypothetical protein
MQDFGSRDTLKDVRRGPPLGPDACFGDEAFDWVLYTKQKDCQNVLYVTPDG